jgi:prophage antirepressor-like protein
MRSDTARGPDHQPQSRGTERDVTNELKFIPVLFEANTLIRVIDRNGDPWFFVSEIGPITGIKNPTRAVMVLDEDEKATITLTDSKGIQGNPDRVIVSESGLYALILRSNAAMKPGTEAHRFRKWVTSELLPTIRKTGRYDAKVDQVKESDASKLQKVAETRRTFGLRAAAKLWVELGLPTVPEMFHAPAQSELPLSPEIRDEAEAVH